MTHCSHCGMALDYRMECFACHAEFCRACFETVIIPSAGLCPCCDGGDESLPPSPRKRRRLRLISPVLEPARC